MSGAAARLEEFCAAFGRLFAAELKDVPFPALCLFTVGASAAVFFAAGVYGRKRGQPVPFRRCLVLCLLLSYGFFIAAITLLNRENGSRVGISSELPFVALAGQAASVQQLAYAALNVLLFVPWGALLAFWWAADGALRRLAVVTLYSFVSSFAVELLQLVTARGYFELADIVTNTLGGFGGALCAGLLLCLARRAAGPASLPKGDSHDQAAGG